MTGKVGRRRGKSLVLGGALAVALVSSGSAFAATPGGRPVGSASLATGQTGPRSAVPWREVGPGWVLAEYWPGRYQWEAKPAAAAATLYLIDPAGGRYRLHRWPVTKNPPFLTDWSGDKTRALVSWTSGALEQVVLATGKVSRFRLPGGAQVIAYTRPSGQGLLGWRRVGSRMQLARYGLRGQLAKVLISDTSSISALYSGDGSALAIGGPHGVLLVSNRGGVIRALSVPGTRSGCAPSRWWNSRVILARCSATSGARSRLWLVPVSGAKPTALTAPRGRHSPDPGDVGAWQLHGRLYLQALTSSGIGRIFRQPANGQVVAVNVPRTAGDNWVLAARGPGLLLAAEQDPCADSNSSLTWFNPVTGDEQMLIRTPHAVAGVLRAVPYGQSLAPIFSAVVCVSASIKRAANQREATELATWASGRWAIPAEFTRGGSAMKRSG